MKLRGDHPRHAWRHARRLGQTGVVAHVVEPSRVDSLDHVGRQHTITNTRARRSELVHAPRLVAPAPAAPIAETFKCASGPLGDEVRLMQALSMMARAGKTARDQHWRGRGSAATGAIVYYA